MLPTPFGLPSFLRFARFRAIGIPLAMMGLEVHRETAQNAKAWPFFRSSLTRSRSCVYLQPSTQYAWSLDLSPQSITLRRATLGKNTGVVTFVSATTAETESAHVRRTLLVAVGFGGDTSLLSCTFCASARDSMAKFDRFPLFSASLGWRLPVNSRQWPKTAEIDQGSAGQSCELPPPANTVGLCWQ